MKANDLRRFFAFKTGIFRQLAKKDRLGLRKEYGVTMKLYQPDYYEQFQCTASKCPTTCCMQWRIAVDDETFFRWDEEWKSHVKQGEDGYVIALGQDGMCPFLNDEKLCKIVIRDGDQAISHTCQTFPREEHIYNGRIERALTPGCPAVLDLLWQQESFWLQEREESKTACGEITEVNPILFEIREWLLEIVTTKGVKLNTALEICFLIVKDLNELEENGSLEEKLQAYKNATDLKEIQDAIGDNDEMTSDRMEEYNLLFLDVSEIYRRQNIYTDFLLPLADAAEQLDSRQTKEWDDFRQKIQPFKSEAKRS